MKHCSEWYASNTAFNVVILFICLVVKYHNISINVFVSDGMLLVTRILLHMMIKFNSPKMDHDIPCYISCHTICIKIYTDPACANCRVIIAKCIFCLRQFSGLTWCIWSVGDAKSISPCNSMPFTAALWVICHNKNICNWQAWQWSICR